MDHAIYGCRVDRYATGERALAKARINRLLVLGMAGSLPLFGRWYPSFMGEDFAQRTASPSAGFIAFLCETGFHFVMRPRGKFNLTAGAIKTRGWINLDHILLNTINTHCLAVFSPPS